MRTIHLFADRKLDLFECFYTIIFFIHCESSILRTLKASLPIDRRQMACWLVSLTALPLVGCGGGGVDPLGVIDTGNGSNGDFEPVDCNLDGEIDLNDDCNRDGVLDEKDSQCCRPRGGGSSANTVDTLYDAYLALQPGMTKAQVIALVPVSPSQGAGTDQVLWVKGDEALGVEFKGSSNTTTIVFAQWGLSIAAGGRNESRRF